jgi:hypothetical protein
MEVTQLNLVVEAEEELPTFMVQQVVLVVQAVQES